MWTKNEAWVESVYVVFAVSVRGLGQFGRMGWVGGGGGGGSAS